MTNGSEIGRRGAEPLDGQYGCHSRSRESCVVWSSEPPSLCSAPFVPLRPISLSTARRAGIVGTKSRLTERAFRRPVRAWIDDLTVELRVVAARNAAPGYLRNLASFLLFLSPSSGREDLTGPPLEERSITRDQARTGGSVEGASTEGDGTGREVTLCWVTSGKRLILIPWSRARTVPAPPSRSRRVRTAKLGRSSWPVTRCAASVGRSALTRAGGSCPTS